MTRQQLLERQRKIVQELLDSEVSEYDYLVCDYEGLDRHQRLQRSRFFLGRLKGLNDFLAELSIDVPLEVEK